MIRIAVAAAYIATVPAANWAVQNVGTCVPNGPCVIPVGLGLTAPSGVLFIGVALVLRDLVQRQLGLWVSLYCVLMGAIITGFIAPPALVFASVAAFGLSELLDTGLFTKLQERGLVLAVLASSVLAAILDSAVFLWIAFGSLDHMAGQVVGKLTMVALSTPLILLARRARP